MLFSIFLTMVKVPVFSDKLLGFWAFVPLLITIIIGFMFKPSIAPIKKLFDRIHDEPALILYALYGISPFFLFLICDEIQAFWIMLIALLSILILPLGVYLFLRSEKKKIRLTSIILAGLLAVALTFFAVCFYWK